MECTHNWNSIILCICYAGCSHRKNAVHVNYIKSDIIYLAINSQFEWQAYPVFFVALEFYRLECMDELIVIFVVRDFWGKDMNFMPHFSQVFSKQFYLC